MVVIEVIIGEKMVIKEVRWILKVVMLILEVI